MAPRTRNSKAWPSWSRYWGSLRSFLPRLEPFLTVYSGRMRPDPAFASAEVLDALGLNGTDVVAQRQRWNPEAGLPAPGLPGGQSLVGERSGTYSIDSRAKLADGRESLLRAVVRLGCGLRAGQDLHTVALGRGSSTQMNSMADRSGGSRWLDRLPQSARWRHGAGGFLGWWGRSLAAWLPARLRLRAGPGPRPPAAADRTTRPCNCACSKATTCRTWPWCRQTGSFDDATATRLLGSRLSDLPRWLILPAATALRRRLVLPAAAADRLRDVVGFEIDRQTPFTMDAVAYDARVLGQRESDGQLDVELVAVPRMAIDPALAALGPLAPGLAGIDVAAANGTPLGVNLLDPARRHRQSDPWRRWNLALLAVALLALAATMAQLLDNRRAAADELEQRIARNAQAARQAAAQRQRLSDLVEGQAFLDRTRAARPMAVAVIDELTRRLPDTTYLEKLSIEDDRLTLIGLSREAPALIGRLQGSRLWRSPALTGALQPDPASGRDRFTLTAELVGAAPARHGARRCRKPLTAIVGWRWRCCWAFWRWRTSCWCIRGGPCRCARPTRACRPCRSAKCASACSCSRRRWWRSGCGRRAIRGFLPEASAELATAALVQRLETIVSQASPGNRSCAITNRSPMSEPRRDRFARVVVQVRLRCGTPELAAVLHSIESGTPRLFVGNLNVLCAALLLLARHGRQRRATRRRPGRELRSLRLPAGVRCSARLGGAPCALIRPTPRTWLLAAVAGWAVLAWLLTLAGMGRHASALDVDTSQLPPLPQPRASAAAPAGPLSQFDQIGARPLFSDDRQPKPFSLQGTGGGGVGAGLRFRAEQRADHARLKLAILQSPDRSKSLRVKLGESPESQPSWRLTELSPRSAVFEGPEGRRSMDLRTFDGTGGEPPTAIAQPGAAPVGQSVRRPPQPQPQPQPQPAAPSASPASRAAAAPTNGVERAGPQGPAVVAEPASQRASADHRAADGSDPQAHRSAPRAVAPAAATAAATTTKQQPQPPAKNQ